jgi:3-oxo-5-alpha-steroid 4-dehydrogenase 1
VLEFLTHINHDTFIFYMYLWGAVAIVSPFALHLIGELPISNRSEHNRLSFFGTIDKKLGWMIMETPILITVLYFFLSGSNTFNVSALIVGAFVCHYINRALIYPQRIKTQGKTMPVSIMLSSMIFYIVNGYVIGYYFGSLKSYPVEWLYDPRFIIGLTLFLFGLFTNIQSDNILINLRKPGETGYKIPQGGMYRFISCPNYFGEMVEWIGFAIMSWSIPGAVYALWVALPLFAQGQIAHRWYVEKFGNDYPKNRKAIIPFLI